MAHLQENRISGTIEDLSPDKEAIFGYLGV